MANPKVQKILDKSKKFFINHGEKLAVGLGGLMFLAGVGKALTTPTIALTPSQISTNTDAAKKNLQQQQSEEDILAALEADGIRELNFAETVEKSETEKVDVAELQLKHKWISLEPGAGLIRDQPLLVAINEVFAAAGRGGANLFEVDENGKRIPDDGSSSDEDSSSSSRRRGRNSGGFGLGFGGSTAEKSDREKQEEEARFKADQERRSRSLAGSASGSRDRTRDSAKSSDSPDSGEAEMNQGPFKESLQSLRWGVVTGVIDHKKLRENYAKALRQDEKNVNPDYRYVELERQMMSSDGVWSDWEPVDINQKYAVIDNLTETDEELVPDDNRLESLCDPLPFLVNGAFNAVHVAGLVPKDKREIKRPENDQRNMMGGMPGMMGRGGRGGMGMGMASGSMMPGEGGAGMMGMGMMSDEYSGFMFGGGTGSYDEGNFPKTDADEVMVRAFDFSVNPDTTYRYRARLVVNNPNFNRDDVNPGVDISSETLTSEWSEITNPIYVPSDVATYAIQKTPAANERDSADKVTFYVTSFNPDDGITVVRQFIAGPGQIIGEPTSTQIPASDGSGAKPKTIDFTSRQIVLGTEGGNFSLAPLGGNGSITMPAIAFVMKPDGSIAVRNESRDLNDRDLDFTRRVYDEELKKSDKKRERGSMSDFGMEGMMGSMGPGGGAY